MSILTKIEEHIKRKKLENQEKVYQRVHKILLEMDPVVQQALEEVAENLIAASNYETLMKTINNLIDCCEYAVVHGSLGNIKVFKNLWLTLLRFKICILFFSGYLGFLWL